MERRGPSLPPTGAVKSRGRNAQRDGVPLDSDREVPQDAQRNIASRPVAERLADQLKVINLKEKSSTASRSETSAAGIVADASSQSRIVPRSVRADGSVRKERRVREGFVPTEDVPKYRPGQGRVARELAAALPKSNDTAAKTATARAVHTATDARNKTAAALLHAPKPSVPTGTSSDQDVKVVKTSSTTSTTRSRKTDALDEALSKLSLGDTSSSRWA